MHDPSNDLDEEDILRYRKKFPITEKGVVYLNHAGVAPTSVHVCEAVGGWLKSLAETGEGFAEWEKGADRCRERFARLVGCSANEVAFVRNTSHGLSLVAEGLPWQQGQRIVVTPAIEYPSNVHPWKHVARSRGLIVDEISPRDGGVDVEAIAEALRPKTRLVAVSSAQYGTGAVTNLMELGQLCTERDVLFCVDGIQTLGALPIDVRKIGIHFLAADSHKWMLGMMGMGAVYIHRDLAEEMRPALVGWKSMIGGWGFQVANDKLLPHAGRFEEGSPAYALIEGFSAALKLLHEVSVEAIADRLGRLVDRLASGLEALGCRVTPPPELRHHILCFTHPERTSQELKEDLFQSGIIVSDRGGGVRVSPHFYNTEHEIDQLIEAVRNITHSVPKGE